MRDRLDYTICPKCDALNAARWIPMGNRSYKVVCGECDYEYEHGHYESARNLTFEQFLKEAIQTIRIEEYEAVLTDEEIGIILLLGEIRDYRDDDNDAF